METGAFAGLRPTWPTFAGRTGAEEQERRGRPGPPDERILDLSFGKTPLRILWDESTPAQLVSNPGRPAALFPSGRKVQPPHHHLEPWVIADRVEGRVLIIRETGPSRWNDRPGAGYLWNVSLRHAAYLRAMGRLRVSAAETKSCNAVTLR